MKSKVPILFLTFNRYDETIKSFEKIIEYKPTELYIASDGPRLYKIGENGVVISIREYILSRIDWPCKISTRFIDNNEGCKYAVSNSITWFFENVEYGVIIEDDCVVDVSFFEFCNQLLILYKNNEDIWHIDASNFISHSLNANTYHFSKYYLIWGWATWRRAWKKYSISMEGFDSFINNQCLKNVFKDKLELIYWEKQLKLANLNQIDTWDYQWFYTIWSNNGLSIRPDVNLVQNIGFSETATHTKKSNLTFTNMIAGVVQFPLVSNKEIQQNKINDIKCSRIRFNIIPFYKKVFKKIFKT
jgi:hypothetical protein